MILPDYLVLPAQAGIHGPRFSAGRPWTPAFAGATVISAQRFHLGRGTRPCQS